MVVARDDEHAAVRGAAIGIAVLERVAGAIKTDFILSAEIMTIILANIVAIFLMRIVGKNLDA